MKKSEFYFDFTYDIDVIEVVILVQKYWVKVMKQYLETYIVVEFRVIIVYFID